MIFMWKRSLNLLFSGRARVQYMLKRCHHLNLHIFSVTVTPHYTIIYPTIMSCALFMAKVTLLERAISSL